MVEWNSQNSVEPLESKMGSKEFFQRVVFPIVLVGGFLGCVWGVDRCFSDAYHESIRKNLAPHALYFGGDVQELGIFLAAVYNKDVDRDGAYESILEFVDPMYHKDKLMLVEQLDDRSPVFVGYKVIDRQLFAPSAHDFRGDVLDLGIFSAFAYNKDVDQNRTLESVLNFENPVTGQYETRLLEEYRCKVGKKEIKCVSLR